MRICSKCGRPLQEWNGWGVNVAKHLVTGHSGTFTVPRDAASAMYLLIKAKGEVVSMDALILGLFGNEDVPEEPEGRVYVALSKLRKILGPIIVNVQGDGWYLNP